MMIRIGNGAVAERERGEEYRRLEGGTVEGRRRGVEEETDGICHWYLGLLYGMIGPS